MIKSILNWLDLIATEKKKKNMVNSNDQETWLHFLSCLQFAKDKE